jgi:hypothetical protein
MRDAWLAGMGLKENVSRQSMAGDNPGAGCSAANLLGPMNSVLGAMADLAAANRPRLDRSDAGAAGHSAPSGQHDPPAVDFLLPMSQAMMIAANRSISYWLGLARIFESHQMTLAQAMFDQVTSGQVMDVPAIDEGVAGSKRLVAADKLRALLREVGDLAAKEARIFQNELSALDESVARTFQQTEPSGTYRRRWRAKA